MASKYLGTFLGTYLLELALVCSWHVSHLSCPNLDHKPNLRLQQGENNMMNIVMKTNAIEGKVSLEHDEHHNEGLQHTTMKIEHHNEKFW
jgi:hypothetical protein